ncbi:MAG: PHB depolymerase family esterase [bacterium]
MKPFLLLLLLSSVALGADWSSRSAGGIDARIAIPAQHPAGGRPLFVLLHGCAQSNTALEQHTALAALAEERGAIIALPRVPGGGVIAGCWDYYGAAHARGSRHTGPLLAFTEALLADADLDVDPAAVYVGGLSSGAGQALVAGCLAPDLFAGIAVAGSPGLGTEASAIAAVSTTPDAVATLCTRLAGPAAADLGRQRAAIIVGGRDFIVAQGYGRVNAEGLAQAYGASPAGSAPVDGGEAALWADARGPRVALLTMPGLDHAWPSGVGQGATLEFVAQGGLDFAAWSLDFFAGADAREPEPPAEEADGGIPMADAGGAPCPPPVSVVATLPGHATRLAVYPGGYGVADMTYIELLERYGVQTAFPLYQGEDGAWYHDQPAANACETPEVPEPYEPVDQGRPPPGYPPDAGVPAGDEGVAAQDDGAGGCSASGSGGGGWLLLVAAVAVRRRRSLR